jgi:hypothetical protein
MSTVDLKIESFLLSLYNVDSHLFNRWCRQNKQCFHMHPAIIYTSLLHSYFFFFYFSYLTDIYIGVRMRVRTSIKARINKSLCHVIMIIFRSCSNRTKKKKKENSVKVLAFFTAVFLSLLRAIPFYFSSLTAFILCPNHILN